MQTRPIPVPVSLFRIPLNERGAGFVRRLRRQEGIYVERSPRRFVSLVETGAVAINNIS